MVVVGVAQELADADTLKCPHVTCRTAPLYSHVTDLTRAFMASFRGVVAIWLRHEMDDSAIWIDAKAKGTLHGSPLWLAVTTHRAATLTVFGVVSLWASGFYVCFVWMRVYMHTISPHPIASAPSIAGGMLVWLCVVFPVMGWLSDVVGSRDRVMLWGGSSMAAMSIVLFMQVSPPPPPSSSTTAEFISGTKRR
jgi:hypothetical protein